MVQTWSNDTYEFKMLMWIKIMKFDCKLAMVDFFPNTVDFLGQLLNWLSKNVVQGLKLDMSNLEGP